MKRRNQDRFTTVRAEGKILPPDLLGRVSANDLDLGGLRPEDYHLLSGESINEAISRSWNRLLGTWAATQLDKDFYLVNLVRKGREKTIVEELAPHLRIDAHRGFQRWTWEEVYRFVVTSAPETKQKKQLLSYMDTKTLGYNSKGQLQVAFQLGGEQE